MSVADDYNRLSGLMVSRHGSVILQRKFVVNPRRLKEILGGDRLFDRFLACIDNADIRKEYDCFRCRTFIDAFGTICHASTCGYRFMSSLFPASAHGTFGGFSRFVYATVHNLNRVTDFQPVLPSFGSWRRVQRITNWERRVEPYKHLGPWSCVMTPGAASGLVGAHADSLYHALAAMLVDRVTLPAGFVISRAAKRSIFDKYECHIPGMLSAAESGDFVEFWNALMCMPLEFVRLAQHADFPEYVDRLR